MPNHPILEQSFAIIDREIGSHNFTQAEYAIVRRVIHSTADFDFKHLINFSPEAIETAVAALRRRVPVVTDVSMVKQGVATLVSQTFANPLISAVELVPVAPPGKTRSETGMLQCLQQWPDAIFAVGNAPTALLALCSQLSAPAGPASETAKIPPLIIGAPVGFVSVIESKAALAQLRVPQIRVEGRKGGSPVAAAILNALIVLAWEGSDK